MHNDPTHIPVQARTSDRAFSLRQFGLVVSVLVVAFIILCAIFGSWIVGNTASGDLAARNQGPIGSHWLGTDDTGADVGDQLLLGARTAVVIGGGATLIGTMMGVLIGAIMGMGGGWIDTIGMRFMEIKMAVPRLLLLLVVIASIGTGGGTERVWILMVVMGVLGWMRSARLVRAEVMRLKHTDIDAAAIVTGAKAWRRLRGHLLPAALAPVIVDASFTMAGLVLMEASLSFLGVGLVPPTASWGQMLAGAVDPSTGEFRWWLAVFPGGMILLLVWSLNAIGEHLRSRLHPDEEQ
ncbi:MAG TPA: ABC transporter permease [Phycisphaerales bacterium]|nr:ABC transporter permease [Phycisphaerales bacterium]